MLQGKQLSPNLAERCVHSAACLPARRTCDSVRLMFLRFLRAAKVRLDTSSLLLEASGVSTKPTMKGAMPLALLQQQQPGNTQPPSSALGISTSRPQATLAVPSLQCGLDRYPLVTAATTHTTCHSCQPGLGPLHPLPAPAEVCERVHQWVAEHGTQRDARTHLGHRPHQDVLAAQRLRGLPLQLISCISR